MRCYTQQDPIGLAGGLNLYGFASGDPVNFSDPFGLCPPCTITDWSAFPSHIVPKHVLGTRGPATLFADADESALRHMIRQTVEGGQHIATETVGDEVRHTFQRNWKTPIGRSGESVLRVVVTEAGELRTAFPRRSLGQAIGAGIAATGRGAARYAGKAAGAALVVFGIVLDLTVGATPAQ